MRWMRYCRRRHYVRSFLAIIILCSASRRIGDALPTRPLHWNRTVCSWRYRTVLVEQLVSFSHRMVVMKTTTTSSFANSIIPTTLLVSMDIVACLRVRLFCEIERSADAWVANKMWRLCKREQNEIPINGQIISMNECDCNLSVEIINLIGL